MSLDLHHLGAAYVLDALEPHERTAFEAHMPQCSICTGDVADYRTTAAALALATRHTPPDALRPRVMGQIAQTRQMQRFPQVFDHRFHQIRPRRPGPSARARTRVLAGVAVLVSLLCLFTIGWPNDDRSAPLASTSDASVTTLDARDQTDSGLLQIVWSTDSDDVVVIGSGLAAAGDGLAYELWVHADDGAISPVGLFEPTNGAVSTMLAVGDVLPTAWSVSLEPAGGSARPTSAVLYGEAVDGSVDGQK